MAEFFIPTVNQVETLQDRQIYQVDVTPMAETISITVTSNRDVAAEWVAMFHPEHRSFFPFGVDVHTGGGEIPHVMTLCTGQECLVLNLLVGNTKNLSRDVKVFLRDVCTCYGWRTDGYEDLIKTTNATLSLGRLTDIQTIVQNGHNMKLGDFSMMVFGRQVPEPVSIWGRRSFKKNQIRETVMEAYISQNIGRMNPHLAPANTSLLRVISDVFPRISIVEDFADKKVYQVSVDGNLTLLVTYTNRLSVLTSWLSSLGRLDNQRPDLIGIDKNHNHRGVDTVVGLAFGHECIVFNLYKSKQSSAGSLVYPKYGLTMWVKIVTTTMAIHNFIRDSNREDYDFARWQRIEEYHVHGDEDEDEYDDGSSYEPTDDRAMEALRDTITSEISRGRRLPY